MNDLEIPLEAEVWALVLFGVKREVDENIRVISSFYLSWVILENWGKKYVENIILASWLKFNGKRN